jgi:glycosyltransferase involved in cell wall biosynthesis
LFLSRLHPKKGVVDRLLPAFAEQNAPAFLAIVGGPDDGAPEHPEEIRRAIERLGLSDRVALLGAVTAAERWAMFDGADLFVLPSHQENFGLVVTEAMARGVPVLITDQVQSGALVRAAEAGLVVRASEFTSSLRRMLADQPSRVAMGIRGAAYARLHFRWNRIAGELAALYRNVTLGGS